MILQPKLISISHKDPQTYHWHAGTIQDFNYDLYAFWDEDFDCWRVLAMNQHLDSATPNLLFQAFVHPDMSHIIKTCVEFAYPAIQREMKRHLDSLYENN